MPRIIGAFGPRGTTWEAILFLACFTPIIWFALPLLIIIVFVKLITGGYTTRVDSYEAERKKEAELKRWVKRERRKDERIEKRERLQKMKMKMGKTEFKKWKHNERLKEKKKRMKNP